MLRRIGKQCSRILDTGAEALIRVTRPPQVALRGHSALCCISEGECDKKEQPHDRPIIKAELVAIRLGPDELLILGPI